MTAGVVADAVRGYLTVARWFGGKGRDFEVVDVRRAGILGEQEPPGPRLAVELVTLEYADASAGTDNAPGRRETYQMPLAYYTEPQERLEHALVGSWEDEQLGAKVLAYDAVHDREAAALWLAAFDEQATVEGDLGTLVFHRLPGHELDLDSHSTLFSGEQSNSSLAFGEDCLLKVFRKVTHGRNPDIVIHEALTQRESEHVASLYGWLELLDPEAPDAEPVQLAMLQQFLRTASDGWELALASVRDLFAEADLRADEVGGDFAGEAERLGLATAQVHDVLAEAFPTETWGPDGLERISADMLARLEAALPVVPDLAPYAEPLRETFRGVAELGAAGQRATAQRVHGDFHLGQTLRTVKGWKIVDFEGEPAKPLAERVRPDLVWRDVAGMLRSFDYAAHAVEHDMQADAESAHQIAFRAAEWVDRNQAAFLRGYVENSGRTAEGDLSPEQDRILRAYVADKAVYEAVYEARNRPSWLPIPLGAIARLTGSDTTDHVPPPQEASDT